MRLLATLSLIAASCSVLVQAAPHPLLPILPANGEPLPNAYIVQLKANASKDFHLNWLERQIAHHPHSRISHKSWDKEVFNGFAGTFSEESLAILRTSPDVDFIEQDAIVHTTATINVQSNAPWGLNRISHKKKSTSTNDQALNYIYDYDSRAGAGVDIYIVDTGINVAHEDFGGRAKWGATFGGYANADGNGHGTHCAGTAVGTRYGVAKKATAIAVKVLSDQGSGSLSDVISGINWVVGQYKSTKRPSVISMSLGGGASQSLDNSATNAVSQGVHVVVAAGNDNVNAEDNSPARAANVITVGASTISDARAYFSNYGSVVDIFAPGLDVTSTWIGSKTATQSLSGTSMATPHVSGMVAYAISLNGNMSPSAMRAKIQELGQWNKLSGVPSGTRNQLLYNGDGL